MSLTCDIVNILVAARAPVTVDRIAAVLSIGPRVVSSLLSALHQAGRVTRAPLHQKRFEYWMSAAQLAAEQSKRVGQAPRVASTLNVMILTDAATLSSRLSHLERLLAREALSPDAILRSIAGDYRATLAAVRLREALADEVDA